MLGGQRDDIATRLERHAASGRRHRRAGDLFVRFRRARAQRRRVRHDANGDLSDLLARQAEQIDAPAFLKHDRVRTDRRERDVEVVELRHLADGAAAEILGPDVVALLTAAVREEIDRVAEPHRLRVVRRVVRDVARRERLQIEQPEIRRPAAAIALPVAEVLRHRHVDEARAVRRERAELAVRHRQLLGKAAVEADEIELVVALPAALARGRKQDALAVRVPADHAIGHRVIGQARRRAASSRDHVHVGVAVVVGGIGDLRSVR